MYFLACVRHRASRLPLAEATPDEVLAELCEHDSPEGGIDVAAPALRVLDLVARAHGFCPCSERLRPDPATVAPVELVGRRAVLVGAFLDPSHGRSVAVWWVNDGIAAPQRGAMVREGGRRPSTSASSVGAGGFEPPTSCSQSRCATRLRYAPCARCYPAGRTVPTGGRHPRRRSRRRPRRGRATSRPRA